MLQIESLQSEVDGFIRGELMHDPDAPPLEPNLSLIDAGILDSLGILKLVMFLEQRLAIQIDPGEVIPDNFATLNAISSFLIRREEAPRPG